MPKSPADETQPALEKGQARVRVLPNGHGKISRGEAHPTKFHDLTFEKGDHFVTTDENAEALEKRGLVEIVE